MKALLDFDVLAYEVGFGSQFKTEDGEVVARDLEDAILLLEHKINLIEEAVGSTEPSVLYLTGDERIRRHENRTRKRNGDPLLPYKENFRIGMAKTVPYKDRPSTKPIHFHNLRSHALNNYQTKVAWGMEADDMLGVDCLKDPDRLVVCTRDKDLHMLPCTVYGWEVHNQPEYGPVRHTEPGTLDKKGKSTGWFQFYSQLITGDSVDTIPGLPRCGPAKAFSVLEGCETEQEMYDRVKSLYQEKVGEGWQEYMQEQANLLYMVRELNEDGSPVLYLPPHIRKGKR